MATAGFHGPCVSGPPPEQPWASIARKDPSSRPPPTTSHPPPPPPPPLPGTNMGVGVRKMVVDANAFIEGIDIGNHLLADQMSIVTVREVLEEIRDPRARARLASLPFNIECIEPDEEAIEKVIQFARATGDIQSLSKNDIKVIALTYTLEAQEHGTANIRSKPPPIIYNPVLRHKEPDPVGWGSNIPNPEEWVAFPEEEDGDGEGQPDPTSHIVGLKDLNANKNSDSRSDGAVAFHEGVPDMVSETSRSSYSALSHSPLARSGKSTKGSVEKRRNSHDRQGQTKSQNQDTGGFSHAVKSAVQVKEGKLMVYSGIDASCGELQEEQDGDWEKAMSRSSRRKHTKKNLKFKSAAKASLADFSQHLASSDTSQGHDKQERFDPVVVASDKSSSSFDNETQDLAEDPSDPRDGSGADVFHGDEENDQAKCMENSSDSDHIKDTALAESLTLEDFGRMSVDENKCDSVDLTSQGDELNSAPSCMILSLQTSSIACLTTDFAMQNVILQMGLRLLSPRGVQVRELHRWMLKCQACGHVTRHVGRIFCPRCGNGGTLFKVSVTVGANGCVQGGRLRRVNLRGTRYSLPLPKGGREGASLNPILREDQLPQRLLHPRVKKGSTSDVLEGLSFSEFASKGTDKKFETIFPVREATAIFTGRVNPNARRAGRRH